MGERRVWRRGRAKYVIRECQVMPNEAENKASPPALRRRHGEGRQVRRCKFESLSRLGGFVVSAVIRANVAGIMCGDFQKLKLT